MYQHYFIIIYLKLHLKQNILFHLIKYYSSPIYITILKSQSSRYQHLIHNKKKTFRETVKSSKFGLNKRALIYLIYLMRGKLACINNLFIWEIMTITLPLLL